MSEYQPLIPAGYYVEEGIRAAHVSSHQQRTTLEETGKSASVFASPMAKYNYYITCVRDSMVSSGAKNPQLNLIAGHQGDKGCHSACPHFLTHYLIVTAWMGAEAYALYLCYKGREHELFGKLELAWQVWAGLNIFIWTYAMVILMVNWCKLSSSGASLLQIFLDVDWVPSLNTGEDKYNIIVEFTQESLRTDAMFAETARARMLGLFSSLRSTKLSFNIYGRKWRSEFKLWPQAAIIANFLLTWAFTFFLGVAILRRYAHLHFDY